MDEGKRSLDELKRSLDEQKRSLDERKRSWEAQKTPSAGPKRPLSEPMSRWERSKTRWSDSGTGRNGRERLESGIGTTENTESTQRGGDEHGDERALGAGGGGSPAGPGGTLAWTGRRAWTTARKGSKTGFSASCPRPALDTPLLRSRIGAQRLADFVRCRESRASPRSASTAPARATTTCPWATGAISCRWRRGRRAPQ